jgi:hypothetical protein
MNGEIQWIFPLILRKTLCEMLLIRMSTLSSDIWKIIKQTKEKLLTGLLRCIFIKSRGDINKLQHNFKQAKQDWQDII